MAKQRFFEWNGKKVYDNQINRAIYLGEGLKNNNWLNRALVSIGSFFRGVSSFMSEANTGNKGILGSLVNSWTGAGTTGMQDEMNAFNAAEAQKQRDYETMMSNTAYQRQVADLQQAGINPIMAASNGVSLPSSVAASSVSPSAATFQMGQMLDLIKLKEMLPLEKEALRSQIKQTEADTDKTKAETFQIGINVERLKLDIENARLDNYSKGVLNTFLERQQNAELEMKNASADYYLSLVRRVDKEIEKMDYEECEIFMRCCDLQEHIQYLLSQEQLSAKQVEELSASIKKLNADTRLLGLQADNFDDLSVVGSSSTNFRGGPFSAGESHPVTLRDLKERAEKRKNELSESKGRSMKDIKRDYPE